MKIFFVVRPSVPTYDPSRNFLTAPRHVYMFFAPLIFVCLSIVSIRYLHWSPPSFRLPQLWVSCYHWSRSMMLFDCRQRHRGEIISIINKSGRFRNSTCIYFICAAVFRSPFPWSHSLFALIAAFFLIATTVCVVFALIAINDAVWLSSTAPRRDNYFRWHERCALFFKGASVPTTSLLGIIPIFLHYTSQVGEGLFVVNDCEVHWTCRAASLYG
jgi:hypothetical protein